LTSEVLGRVGELSLILVRVIYFIKTSGGRVVKKKEGHLKGGLKLEYISFYIDSFVVLIGKAVSWIWLVVLLVVLFNVFSRYLFNSGSAAMLELSWHLFGATMLIVLSYAVVTDDHVRVDFLSEKLPVRCVALIEFLLISVLVIPLLVFMTETLVQYAWNSFVKGESSMAPDGLPYRFILKSIIPFSILLLMLSLVSRLIKDIALVLGKPKK
tara:strand:+ start:596 stop:1231 length:636 start_codon:yes stop_codon:yes gene_type:complete